MRGSRKSSEKQSLINGASSYTKVDEGPYPSYGLYYMIRTIGNMNFFLTIALAAYLGIIAMNFTFTFDQLPRSAIPFYEPPKSQVMHRLSDRYGMWWWLVMVQFLRFFVLSGTQFAMSISTKEGKTNIMRITQWYIFAHGLFDISCACLFLMTMLFSAKCAAVPFCRSWDANDLDVSDVAGAPNWVFKLMTWGTVAFIAVHVLYYNLLSAAIKAVKWKTQS